MTGIEELLVLAAELEARSVKLLADAANLGLRGQISDEAARGAAHELKLWAKTLRSRAAAEAAAREDREDE